MDVCHTVDPAVSVTADGTTVACHLVSAPASSAVGASGSLGPAVRSTAASRGDGRFG
jgi:hypothetical protein